MEKNKSISFNRISFFLLKLSIVFLPLGYDLFSFRVSDLFFYFSFLFAMPVLSLNKNLRFFLLFSVVILLCLLFSQLLGLVYVGFNDVYGLIFFFKYITIFIMLLLFSHHQLVSNLFPFFKILYFLYIVLIAWVFLYLYFVTSGYINGSYRVSFPFSNDYWVSDSHLYSVVLAFLSFSYIFMLSAKLEHSKYKVFLISIFGITSIFLTGSRSGVLVFFIGLIVFTLINIKMVKINYTIAFLFFVFLVFLFVPTIDFQNFNSLSYVVERAMNFSLSNDESSGGRITKLYLSLSETFIFYNIFGVGPLSNVGDWYDGIISILISHGGFMLIFIIFLFLVLYIFYLKLNFINDYQFKFFITLILMYLLSNMITEYVFVFRNSLPIFLIFTLAFTLLSKSRESK